jgi:hypothetical protein
MQRKDARHLAEAFLAHIAPSQSAALVNSRIPLENGYLAAFRTKPDRPLGKRIPNPRVNRGAAFILILLLSLGLWASVWKLALRVMH